MAIHLTEASIQTLLALQVGNMYPSQLLQLVDALNRKVYVLAPDSQPQVGESTLATIFPAAGPNP